MRCMHCGAENSPRNVYCCRCGKYMHVGNQPMGNSGSSSKSSNNLKILLVGLLSFFTVLIVAGVIGFLFMWGNIGTKDDGDKETQEETEEMGSEIEELSSLKDSYAIRYAKYQIDADFQERIQEVNQSLDEAVQEKDVSQKQDFQGKYEAIEEKLLEDNKEQVEDLRYEIARIDTSGADTEEWAKLTSYNDTVASYLQEGDYLHALVELQSYKNYAESVADAAAKRKAEEVSAAQIDMPTVSTGDNEYILEESSSRYLSASDVSWLTPHEAMLAKNEIFARHGRKFRDKEIQEYFNGKSWYRGIYEPDDVTFSDLSAVEQANVNLLKKYE